MARADASAIKNLQFVPGADFLRASTVLWARVWTHLAQSSLRSTRLKLLELHDPERAVSESRAPARRAASTTSLAGLVAIPAKHRPIATWLEGYCGRLPATRADHRSALCRSRAITGTPLTLIVFLCNAARLAALRCRITTFLKERLICSGEGKILPAVAARKLNISWHGVPRAEIVPSI